MLTTTKKHSFAVIACAAGVLFAVILCLMALTHNSDAIDPSAQGFSAGNIIDDYTMTNTSTMGVSQIQDFLNSKVPTCDTSGSQLSEHNNAGVPDYNGDGSIERWEYGKFYFNQTTFTCLKDYSQNGLSAAQIIYNASQKYQINPQVLIVLLQKEQGLVTDSWPVGVQYRSATGYGCPDTSTCDTQYYGLTNQINWSATMFHAIETNNPNWYTPYILGNNYIQYSPDSSCGGSTVAIQNRATQGLYNYTPYQPNDATLNAPMGAVVTCGAYGNINFYRYFTQWFGSPTVPPIYSWSPISQNVYLDAARTVSLPSDTTVAPGQKFYVTIQAKNTGNQVWYNSNTNLATTHPIDRTSLFYNTDWLSPNRPAHMIEPSVKPGETATFQQSFTAPQQQGRYLEYFGIVAEGVTWMNDPGLYLPITVTPARQLSLYSDSAKTTKLEDNPTVYVGSKVYGNIQITNNYTSAIPANVTLGTTNPNDRVSSLADSSWIGPNRVVKLNSTNPLQPGQVGTFNFTLNIPNQAASYPESFGLVVDGTGGGWIETNTASFTINAIDRPKDQLTSSLRLNSGESITSADGKYRLIMQSDGNLVIYSPNRAVWASNTNGSGGNVLIMQSDGNLVIYSPNRAVWASNTNGKL